jgi:hypothetical protein
MDTSKRLRSIVKEKWNKVKETYVTINSDERVIDETLNTNNEFLNLKNNKKNDMIIISEDYGIASGNIEYVVFFAFNYKISIDLSHIKCENCETRNLFNIDGMDSVYALVINVGKKGKYKNKETQRLELQRAEDNLKQILDDVNSTETQKDEAREKVADINGVYYYDFVKNNFELQMVDLKVSLTLEEYKSKVWTQRYVATFPVITLYDNHLIYVEQQPPEKKATITSTSVNEIPILKEAGPQLKDIYSYVCYSNYFGDLTDDVIIENVDKIDITKLGIYTVTYRVTDEIGNMSRVERTVIVRNTKTDPE